MSARFHEAHTASQSSPDSASSTPADQTAEALASNARRAAPYGDPLPDEDKPQASQSAGPGRAVAADGGLRRGRLAAARYPDDRRPVPMGLCHEAKPRMLAAGPVVARSSSDIVRPPMSVGASELSVDLAAKNRPDVLLQRGELRRSTQGLCPGSFERHSILGAHRPGRADITMMRSPRKIASSMLWVMNTTVRRSRSQSRTISSCRIIRSCASKRCERLVHQQHLGLHHQRASDRDPLPHPS